MADRHQIPVVVSASTRPRPELLDHIGADTTVVLDQATWHGVGAGQRSARGGVVVTEPDVHHRSPGCSCCAVREDLVDAFVRATQRLARPERIVVLVDPIAQDVITVVSTLLSSVEIARRCELDAVVADLDAVELATQLATTGDVLGSPGEGAAASLVETVAIADRIVLRRRSHVTSERRDELSRALRIRSGFGRLDADTAVLAQHLDAWHGAPLATEQTATSPSSPCTAILRVATPLDPDAIDTWLEQLITRHARRLLRVQGALSVAGQDERTCLRGVRSFASSHSEREHPTHRSTESLLAISGIGLDVDELAASFQATAAS